MEMKFVLKYHTAVVRKDIPSLSAPIRDRIRTTIESKLATRPDMFGIPLRKSLKGHRKLRVGDYRVVFRIEKNVVYVLGILHRSIVYESVTRRV